MTRKGDVIKNLIEMSRFRKYARILGTAPMKSKRSHVTPEDFHRYTVEVDNALACMTAAIQATIKPRPRKPKKML